LFSQGWYYDIKLVQRNYDIIRQSHGLCIEGSFDCVLELPAVYRDSSRKRNQLALRNPTPEQIFVNEHAEHICNEFLNSARRSAAQLALSSISQKIEDAAIRPA